MAIRSNRPAQDQPVPRGARRLPGRSSEPRSDMPQEGAWIDEMNFQEYQQATESSQVALAGQNNDQAMAQGAMQQGLMQALAPKPLPTPEEGEGA